MITSGIAASVPRQLAFIEAEGWRGISRATADLTFLPVTVQRAGFDAAGAAVTHTVTLYETKRPRLPWPLQAQTETEDISLSDFLYSSDAIAGVRNESALTCPQPIAAVVTADALQVQDEVRAEVTAFHRDAHGGRQVACVRVRANNGTQATAWQTASDTDISHEYRDANPVEVHPFDIDVSGLSDGPFWLESEVYPHFGLAASALKSEDNYAASASPREFTRRWFRKGAAPAYVFAGPGGNDTTGAAHASEATARGAPCATLAGAQKKLHDLLGTAAGALDGAVIYVSGAINSGTVTATGSYKQDVAAVLVTRDPLVARESAVITITGNYAPDFDTSSVGPAEGQLVIRDVSLVLAGIYSFAGSSSPTQNLHTQFIDCAIDMAGFASTLRGSTGHSSFFGCTFANLGSSHPLQNSGAQQLRVMRGVTADLGGRSYEAWVAVGNRLTGAAGSILSDYAKGAILFNNRFPSPTATPINISAANPGDLIAQDAIVQNLIEWTSAAATGGILVASNNGQTSHIVIQHNTGPGAQIAGRWNLLYDEHASVQRDHTLHSFKGNLGPQFNVKGDIFATDGARIGNFPIVHGVACEGNFSISPASAPTSEAQTFPGIGSVIGGGDPLFVDNQAVTWNGSSYVAGAGGGDYHLQAGSPARGLMSGPVTAFDLDGAPRGSGVQNAGAFAEPLVLAAASGSFTLAESAAQGAAAGTLSVAPGAALSLIDDAGGRVALFGRSVVRGASSLDYESATSHAFTVRQTFPGAANSPLDTVLTLTVTDAFDPAPTLTLPADAATGSGSASLSVTTDIGSGTLYWYVSASATPPSAADLKAGTGAVRSGSQAVSASGSQAATVTGLAASTAYYAHFLHSAAGFDSAIVTADGFTTDALSAEASAWFAAMSVQPDTTRKGHLDALVAGLKSDGVWAKLDWLSICAAHDEQAGRVNAVNPAQVATAPVAPTFTTDRGFTGNGSSQSLDSGWNPATASSPKFAQNDAHMGAWIGTDVSGSTQTDLGNSRAAITSRATANLNARPCTATTVAKALGVSTSIGHPLWVRTGSAACEVFKNGATLGTSTQASQTFESSTFLICAFRNSGTPANFSTRRVQAAHWGAALTSGEAAALYSRLATYMTAVGA